MNPLKRQTALKMALAALFFVTAACGGTITSVPPSNLVGTTVAQTLQALTPPASPTQVSPTSTSIPTATSVPPTVAPTSANLPAATRINFVTGATYSIAQGSITTNQTLYYVVKALKDQPMIVMFDTPNHDATLSVFGADGTTLLARSQHVSNWQGTLPSTQDYYFRLDGGGSTENYTLNLEIGARIQFSSGQNQVTLSGKTVGGYAVMYVAYAFGGQQLNVSINTAPEVAALTIWGFSDGQPYARAQNGVTNFSMTLPSTQDYIIEVVPQGGNVVDYQVTVKIQ